MKTLAIIPAYNCSKRLPGVLSGLPRYIPDMLVIDDGSTDNTGEIAGNYGAGIIRHDSRMGKGAALKTGFRYALEQGYDIVLTLDGDGQHEPKYIPAFISAYNNMEADMIIGSRKNDKADMPWDRRFSNWCTSKLLSLFLKDNIEDSQSGFRLISREVLEKIELKSDNFQLETEIIIKARQAGFRIGFTPIRVEYGQDFPSEINGLVDTCRWVRLVLELI